MIVFLLYYWWQTPSALGKLKMEMLNAMYKSYSNHTEQMFELHI